MPSSRQETEKFADRADLLIEKVFAMKKSMLARGNRHDVADCPQCGGVGTLRASLNGPRNHVHAGCACGAGLIE